MKKVTDLRPCDVCGGPHHGLFYVRASAALVENFAPASTTAIVVAMDSPAHASLMTEVVVCSNCYVQPVCLAELAEKRTRAIEASGR